MEYKFQIIAISETWLNENNWDRKEVTMKSHVQVTNSTVIPETNLPGGGVAIYVCESLLNNCQSSDICLRDISYVYNDNLNDNLSFILGNLTSKIVYICGNYNIDLLHCEERAETKYFLDQMFSSGLYPLITRPTRITGTSATIIDNILCSELCRNKVCGIVLSGTTGHMPIFVSCDNSTNVVNNEDPTVKYKRKLDEDSLNRLEHDLNYINWEIVMNESNPNLAFSRCMQVLSNTYSDACPIKITTYTGKTKRNDKPWLKRGLKKCLHKEK